MGIKNQFWSIKKCCESWTPFNLFDKFEKTYLFTIAIQSFCVVGVKTRVQNFRREFHTHIKGKFFYVGPTFNSFKK